MIYSTTVFLFFQMFVLSQTQSKYIIRDYFVYKKVPTVVGFSCGDIESDFHTIKILNNVGISSIIKRPTSQFNISNFLNVTFWKLGVFLDLRCLEQNATNIFYQSSKHRMYDYSYNWLILATNMSYSLQLLNDSAFSITTDFVISVPNYYYYDLYDIYNPCKYRGGILNITKLGTWDENDGLSVTLTEEKILRRWNLHGMKIHIGGIIQSKPKDMPLLYYLENERSEPTDIWSKFGYCIINILGDIFNFTMHAIELKWDKNDTNDPLMQALSTQSVDLGYFPSIITESRLEVARLIAQVFPMRTCFMFREVAPSNIKINMILRPLASESWYLIGLFTIAGIFILALILKLERGHNLDYGISFLINIGALCQQGVSSLPDQAAGRIALLQIMIFGLLMYNYYSAAIVSARLNEPINKMNDSLYSLVKSGLELGTERNIFFDFLLQSPVSLDKIYFKKHWNEIPETKKIFKVDEGIQKIIDGGFAYHSDTNVAYPYMAKYFDNQMICQLTEIHVFRPAEIGLWGSYNGQFLEVAKIGLIKMSNTGIQQRNIKRWTVNKPYCHKDEIASVTIYEAAPILFLLISGVILSIFICIIENIIFYILQSKKSNRIVQREQYSQENFQQQMSTMICINKKFISNMHRH